MMDIDTLVMTLGANSGIRATDAETYAVGSVAQATALAFPSSDEAQRAADELMGASIPAKQYGSVVLVLH